MLARPMVFIIENDFAVSESFGMVAETVGLIYQSFDSVERFLESYDSDIPGCLLLDTNVKGADSLDLQFELNKRKISLPIIFLISYGDLPINLRLFNSKAILVLKKPVHIDSLIKHIQAILQV